MRLSVELNMCALFAVRGVIWGSALGDGLQPRDGPGIQRSLCRPHIALRPGQHRHAAAACAAAAALPIPGLAAPLSACGTFTALCDAQLGSLPGLSCKVLPCRVLRTGQPPPPVCTKHRCLPCAGAEPSAGAATTASQAAGQHAAAASHGPAISAPCVSFTRHLHANVGNGAPYPLLLFTRCPCHACSCRLQHSSSHLQTCVAA